MVSLKQRGIAKWKLLTYRPHSWLDLLSSVTPGVGVTITDKSESPFCEPNSSKNMSV